MRAQKLDHLRRLGIGQGERRERLQGRLESQKVMPAQSRAMAQKIADRDVLVRQRVRQSEVGDMLMHRIVPVDQAVADQDGKQHGQERLGA